MAKQKIVYEFDGDSSKLLKHIQTVHSQFSKLNSSGSRAFNGFNTGTTRASSSIARLNRQLRGLRGNLNSIRTSANRVVTAMAGVGTTIVLLRTAAKAVVGFGKAMAEVRAITNANTEAFARMSNEAQKLGATTMYTAKQAAEGLKFLSMAGMDAQQATASLRHTLNLAQAGSMDLGTAADIVTNIMTAFGKAADETEEAVDDLATVASRSNTSIQQLGDAMKYVSASANTYGISLQETSAAIGVLSDAGMQASLAGTGLRQVFVRIAGQSSAMRKGMAALGITFSEINPEMHSLIDILDRFSQTSITATQISAMFGSRAANAFANLLAGKEKLRSLTEELDNNTGRAQQMADVMGDSLYGQLKKVQSAYEAFFINLMESKETMGTVRDILQTLADTFNYLSGNLKIFEDDSVSGWGGQVSKAYTEVQNFVSAIQKAWQQLVFLLKIFIAVKAVNLAKTFVALIAPIRNTGLATFFVNKRMAGFRLAMAKGSVQTLTFRTALHGCWLTLVGMARGAQQAAVGLFSFAGACRVVAASITAVKYAIGKLLVPLLILWAVIDTLWAIWEGFFGDAEDSAARTRKEVSQLSDEVNHLKNQLQNAEFAIDVKRNADGSFSEVDNTAGAPQWRGMEVKAFKDMDSMRDVVAAMGNYNDMLDKAERTQRRINNQIEELENLEDDITDEQQEQLDTLREEKGEIDKVINALKDKKRFLEQNGEEYVRQKESLRVMVDLQKQLNDETKKLNTESGKYAQTSEGQIEAQKDAIKGLKREQGRNVIATEHDYSRVSIDKNKKELDELEKKERDAKRAFLEHVDSRRGGARWTVDSMPTNDAAQRTAKNTAESGA